MSKAQRKTQERLKRRIARADVDIRSAARPATFRPGSQNRHKTAPIGKR